MINGASPGEQRLHYRVPSPSDACRIRWPEGFGTRFTICVDTEEEFDWRAPLQRESHGTTHTAALPATHTRFAARGVPLTYLIDYPIVSCSRSVDVLRGLVEDGRSTIGTQLHPWVNPPFDEEVTARNSFAGNLPPEVERAKLTALTDAISGAFGRAPRVYRAGRYGIGPHTAALLASLGYRIDTSMRAAYDYHAEGGPDFSAVPNDAFWMDGEQRVVELPLTTVFTGRLRGGGAGFYRALGSFPKARGIAARLGLISRVALSPEDMPVVDAAEAVRVAVGEGLRLLNFSFHSPSVEPGHTPYVRDAADLAAFHAWWDTILDLLDRLGVTPASMDQIIDAACPPPPPSARAGVAGGL